MMPLFLSIFLFLVAIALVPSSQSIIYDITRVKKVQFSSNSHFSKDSLFIDSISHSEYHGEDARWLYYLPYLLDLSYIHSLIH